MKKVALTALTELWDTKGELVFLGDHCKTYKNRELREGLSFETMEYHWEKKALRDTYERIKDFSDRLASAIGRESKRLFSKEHGEKYWNYLYKGWLLDYLMFWFQAYHQLTETAKKYGGFETSLYGVKEYPPLYSALCPVKGKEDVYYSLIYSRILDVIKDRYNIKVVYKDHPGGGEIFPYSVKDRDPIKKAEPSFSNRLYKFLFGRCPVQAYEDVMGDDPRRLKFSTLGKVFFNWALNDRVDASAFKYDRELRGKIKLDIVPKDEFEEVVLSCLVFNMPVAGVEAYKAIEDNMERLYKYVPEVILTYTVGGIDYDGIYIADMQERGAKIYTIFRYSDPYLLNRKYFYSPTVYADKEYMPAKDNTSRNVMTPMYTYAKNRKRLDEYERKYIRFFERGETEFRYRGFQPFNLTDSGVLNRMRQVNFDFFENLSEKTKKELIYRVREYDDYGMPEYLAKNHPQILLDHGFMTNEQKNSYGGKLTEILYDTKLAICETLTTTVFLESVTRGIPTVILNYDYLDDTYYDEEILGYHKRLKEAGVLYDDGKAAAEFVNSCDDFSAWWNEPKRKELIDAIIDRYAFHLDNTFEWWHDELMRISRSER